MRRIRQAADCTGYRVVTIDNGGIDRSRSLSPFFIKEIIDHDEKKKQDELWEKIDK